MEIYRKHDGSNMVDFSQKYNFFPKNLFHWVPVSVSSYHKRKNFSIETKHLKKYTPFL